MQVVIVILLRVVARAARRVTARTPRSGGGAGLAGRRSLQTTRVTVSMSVSTNLRHASAISCFGSPVGGAALDLFKRIQLIR